MKTLTTIAICFFVFAILGEGVEAGERVWTQKKTGKTARGILVSKNQDESKVKIYFSNGTITELSTDALNQSDLAHIKKWKSKDYKEVVYNYLVYSVYGNGYVVGKVNSQKRKLTAKEYEIALKEYEVNLKEWDIKLTQLREQKRDFERKSRGGLSIDETIVTLTELAIFRLVSNPPKKPQRIIVTNTVSDLKFISNYGKSNKGNPNQGAYISRAIFPIGSKVTTEAGVLDAFVALP